MIARQNISIFIKFNNKNIQILIIMSKTLRLNQNKNIAFSVQYKLYNPIIIQGILLPFFALPCFMPPKSKPKPLHLPTPHAPSRQLQQQKLQLQLHNKNHLQKMQNEIHRLEEKIQMEKEMLRKRIEFQELEHLLKKNQIAAKINKKEIIMRKLESIRGHQDHYRIQRNRAILQQEPKTQHHPKHQQDKLRNLNFQSLPQPQQKSLKSLSASHRKSPSSASSSLVLAHLHHKISKQNQYGNRVQRQYCKNRVHSAYSYLQSQAPRILLEKQQQTKNRNRILSQRKPPLPHPIDNITEALKKQVIKITKSNQSQMQKLIKLNYMSNVEINRVRRMEEKMGCREEGEAKDKGKAKGKIKGNGKGDGKMGLTILGVIDRARTQILLRKV